MPILETACLLLVVAAAWFWLDGVRARDAAMSACRRACEVEGLQFLDETVAIRSLKLERDEDGALRMRRVYDFEYSDTGNDRHPGSVVIRGRTVVALHVALAPPDEPQTLH
ncbi:MAG TPA: DUF3301 domain-containing protein [Rhodocyclaceae bacterium]|nr:DUF3301 domain-containing protein [Rhodocyclaceae bacterium]